MRFSLFPAVAVTLVLFLQPLRAAEYDVVIYGGTGAAIGAAVQAKRMGKSVVVVSPDKHLGGLSSGGLGFTDTGNKAVIGGVSREFYHRVWQHYDKAGAWKWQQKEEYGGKGQGTPPIDGLFLSFGTFEFNVDHPAAVVISNAGANGYVIADSAQWLPH